MQPSATRKFDISSEALHMIAMALMLLDHLWASVAASQYWMTCVGRIAFPIFAFMAVEGYAHTHNLRRYLLRLLAFALISEIPFDLFCEGVVFYPFHQNVIWTFLLGLCGIWLIEKVRQKGSLALTILVSLLVIVLCNLLGTILMVDYYGAGVLTVLGFYFFRGEKWWQRLGQLAALFWINFEMLGGRVFPITLLGIGFEFPQQGLALLALLPIWLYRGRKGSGGKAFQYLCYAFYPVHMLILALISH
jgi:hypothetical protein